MVKRPLLEVNDLRVDIRLSDGIMRVVDGVSFTVDVGETLGLVGESGCGKSTVAKAILSLLLRNAVIAGGEILFDGRDVLRATPRELRELRWREIAWIPQNAMNALDPVYTIAAQMREAMTIHGERDRARMHARIREVSDLVGLPPDRLSDYPHQLSGGMKQRACIGMALLLNPKLLIADEPTTALDVILQQQIVRTIRDLQERLGLAVIYISHDISIVAALCRKVAVMYAGQIVEAGPIEQVLGVRPCHPYTMGLQYAVPALRRRSVLVSIQGTPPDLRILPRGCRFGPRCPFRVARCSEEEPALCEVGTGQAARCFRAALAEQLRALAGREETWS